jgi:uncharacterized membrane protein
MVEFFSTTAAQLVIWTAGLAVLTVVAYYVVRRFRDRTGDDQPTSSELLTNFREMHREGDISDVEYRTIKTVLGARFQQELKDSGE